MEAISRTKRLLPQKRKNQKIREPLVLKGSLEIICDSSIKLRAFRLFLFVRRGLQEREMESTVKYRIPNAVDSVANVLTGWEQGRHNYFGDLFELPEERFQKLCDRTVVLVC